jgi:hypothetical protein
VRALVEFTIPLLLDIIRTVGIIVGIIYYISIMRSQRKSRHVQTFQLVNRPFSDVSIDEMNVLMRYEWDDYEDFEAKYGSDVNIESRNLRYKCWQYFDGVGFMFRKGWIDKDMVYMITSAGSVVWMWNKFESIREYKKMMLERGLSPEPPENYGKYIPDQ